jgi:hypothetical protein
MSSEFYIKKGFTAGIGAISTLDRNLSFFDIQDIYGLHRTTVLLWSKESINDYDKGSNRILYEFLKRYNPKNTFEFMDKYSLESNNTLEHISELMLVDYIQLCTMFQSRLKWKRKIVKNLLKINKSLFEIQVKMIKKIIQSEDELFEE